MANSASDARGSEQEIRRKLIEDRSVDVMLSVGPNFFYTVTLPVTLWFLDRGKQGTDRVDEVLFIDARNIYRQIDRAHRDWTPAHIEFLANIVRLWRGEEPELNEEGSSELLTEHFPKLQYVDVPGLCATANTREIAAQGWSLNPGRYVAPPLATENVDFDLVMRELRLDYTRLADEARELDIAVRDTLEAYRS